MRFRFGVRFDLGVGLGLGVGFGLEVVFFCTFSFLFFFSPVLRVMSTMPIVRLRVGLDFGTTILSSALTWAHNLITHVLLSQTV